MGTGPRTTLPLSSNHAVFAASSTHARTVGRHGGSSGTGTPWSRANSSGSAGSSDVSGSDPVTDPNGVPASGGAAAATPASTTPATRTTTAATAARSPRGPILPRCGICALPFLSTGKRAMPRVGDARDPIGGATPLRPAAAGVRGLVDDRDAPLPRLPGDPVRGQGVTLGAGLRDQVGERVGLRPGEAAFLVVETLVRRATEFLPRRVGDRLAAGRHGVGPGRGGGRGRLWRGGG